MGPLLADVFERLFLRDCCDGKSSSYVCRHRVAIRWFCAALGRDARTTDLSPAALDLVAATLAQANYSRPRIRKLREALAAMWRFADRLGLAPPYIESTIARERPLRLPDSPAASPLRHWRPGKRLELPAAAAGTLRRYFHDVYRPQRLLTVEQKTLRDYGSLFASFWRWLGRDATLEDCRNETAAAYFAWQLERGRSPRSVNRHRAHWFAVWRHAAAAGLVPAPPTVAKLATTREAPDAWSATELARLVAATATFRPDATAAGVPYPLLFRALLIIGFHTAVRRRSLLSIAVSDVDFVAGFVTIRGHNVKTRRGRRYQLPPYALEAAREICSPSRALLFPIDPPYASKQLRLLVAAAGLAPSSHRLALFHKLRRSAASAACAAGGMKAASELLDHSAAYVTELYVDPARIPAHTAGARLPAIAGAASELAEARDLLAAGKHHLAAIAARIVLERAVKERFRRRRRKASGGLCEMIRELARLRAIGPESCRLLCRTVQVANNAAHGRDVEPEDVARLIHVVAQFAGDELEGPLPERNVS